MKTNNKKLGLYSDYYEFTMSQTYFDSGDKDTIAYFDVFFRKNPFDGGYLVNGGLEEIIDYIKKFKFSYKDIDYLRQQNSYSKEFLKYLKNLKFTGNIYAAPEGTIVFPNEPVITVEAPIIEAQIIETALLNSFNHGSLIATAAKRITNEAKNISVTEAGARRGNGIESSITASKYAIIGGCDATSNTKSAKDNKIKKAGTMAHSMISFYKDEYKAFKNYAKSNPDNCFFLVDTYDVLNSGIPNAIKVANEYLIPNNIEFKGIRIDSGDLAHLSKKARQMLDEAGFPDAKICLSNGLNEWSINKLVKEKGVMDSILSGDCIISPNDRVGGVYKLIAVNENGEIKSRIKLSEDKIKTINPGYKKTYRVYDKTTNKAIGDIIAFHDELIVNEKYNLSKYFDNISTNVDNYYIKELQTQIYKNGKLIYKTPTVDERKQYCTKDFETFDNDITKIDSPTSYRVVLSEKLRNYKEQLIKDYVKTKKLVP